MVTAINSFPVQSDLRYLLSIQKGQYAVLINMGGHLHDALINDGVHAEILTTEEVSHLSQCDFIFFTPSFSQKAKSTLKISANILRSGGQMLVCFPNRLSLKRLKNIIKKGEETFTPASMKNLAKTSGFLVKEAYGVYPDMIEPSFLVPLETTQTVTHFFETMLIPYSHSAKYLVKIAPFFSAINLNSYLFSDICFVLEKP